jgi:anhydro-N-acetylmuramic acid kinase
MIAYGLMSGTSMDGIDIAALDTDGEIVSERGPSMMIAWPNIMRRRLEKALEAAKQISARDERPGDLAALEHDITLAHGELVSRFIEQVDQRWKRPDIIGFHGQTVLHRPGQGLTVQLGDGALLAKRTGLPVAFDLRANDMAHGGQGAPLVPAYHAALARSLPANARAFPAMFVNIGGISNVTYIPEAGDPLAFDSGPGNALIDQWVQANAGVPFDDGGRIGSEGSVVRAIVDAYLDDPFFARSGPKSLDRNDFTLDKASGLELADGARTLATVTAQAIYRAAENVPAPPKIWIIAGGGRLNANIISDLRQLCESSPEPGRVLTAEQVALNGDAMEAEAWAFLAVRASKGLPLTFPGTTGCREAISGGVIVDSRG